MKSAPPPPLPAHAGVFRLRSAGVADPLAPFAGQTDCLLDLGPEDATGRRAFGVLAVGRGAEIDTHEAAGNAIDVNLGDVVLLPGLVNAHAHLDLTHLGPLEHAAEEGFVAWVERIRAGRAHEPEAIAASVRRGIDLCLRAGTVLVGDIAGAPRGGPSLVPWETLAASPLGGVSFLEFFAIGNRVRPALERLGEVVTQAGARPPTPGARLGLEPHAPNTVALSAYRRAVQIASDFGLPLCTHLAETIEEREFVARGAGPQREMLERLGIWSDAVLDEVGHGRTPIEHLAPVLAEAPFLVAHANDLGPDAERSLATLASCAVSVAYCPRASAYFGAPSRFGPHRYAAMLAAGVNVCLGTDSVVNLPRGVDLPNGPGMSVLDEARLLYRSDGADPATLLAMATVNGARALGCDTSGFRLHSGASPLGLVAVDVAGTPEDSPAHERVLLSQAPARLLASGGIMA